MDLETGTYRTSSTTGRTRCLGFMRTTRSTRYRGPDLNAEQLCFLLVAFAWVVCGVVVLLYTDLVVSNLRQLAKLPRTPIAVRDNCWWKLNNAPNKKAVSDVNGKKKFADWLVVTVAVAPLVSTMMTRFVHELGCELSSHTFSSDALCWLSCFRVLART
jgi:hypothetical protein